MKFIFLIFFGKYTTGGDLHVMRENNTFYLRNVLVASFLDNRFYLEEYRYKGSWITNLAPKLASSLSTPIRSKNVSGWISAAATRLKNVSGWILAGWEELGRGCSSPRPSPGLKLRQK